MSAYEKTQLSVCKQAQTLSQASSEWVTLEQANLDQFNKDKQQTTAVYALTATLELGKEFLKNLHLVLMQKELDADKQEALAEAKSQLGDGVIAQVTDGVDEAELIRARALTLDLQKLYADTIKALDERVVAYEKEVAELDKEVRAELHDDYQKAGLSQKDALLNVDEDMAQGEKAFSEVLDAVTTQQPTEKSIKLKQAFTNACFQPGLSSQQSSLANRDRPAKAIHAMKEELLPDVSSHNNMADDSHLSSRPQLQPQRRRNAHRVFERRVNCFVSHISLSVATVAAFNESGRMTIQAANLSVRVEQQMMLAVNPFGLSPVFSGGNRSHNDLLRVDDLFQLMASQQAHRSRINHDDQSMQSVVNMMMNSKFK